MNTPQLETPESESHAPTACVFTPSPLFTVTVESVNDDTEVHFHAGGQGFWVARMLARLGVESTLCGPFGGESGAILRMLIQREGVNVSEVHIEGANGGYVHDRRDGARNVIADVAGSPLSRHEVDDLYNAALSEAMAAGILVLAGSVPADLVSPDTYARLANDLGKNGVAVVADLSGAPLQQLGEGVEVLKVSHEELIEAGFAPNETLDSIVAGARELHTRTRRHVVITRAEKPAIALIDGRIVELIPPQFEPLDHRGAGDSLTAGIAAGLSFGLPVEESLRLGVAAGALNVTRHGLATGQGDYIAEIARHVEVKPRDDL